MLDIFDPMNSLRLLQQALDDRMVAFRECEIYPDVFVLYDTPCGNVRLTYALFDDDIAQSMALFIKAELIKGVPCFQLGWAAVESERGKGLATHVVSKGLAELKNGLTRNGINRFVIEAIIPESNFESIKLASKLFKNKPNSCTDSFSGVSVLQFLKLLY